MDTRVDLDWMWIKAEAAEVSQEVGVASNEETAAREIKGGLQTHTFASASLARLSKSSSFAIRSAISRSFCVKQHASM